MQVFENNKFSFGTGKFLKINNIDIWFQRLSYVGELGWELYIPIKESKKIYEIINNIGKNFNMVHAGRLAMDIMRMEKGYLHWGHDISPAENPYESGLDFALKEQNWFYISVVDFLGCETSGNQFYYELEYIFFLKY